MKVKCLLLALTLVFVFMLGACTAPGSGANSGTNSGTNSGNGGNGGNNGGNNGGATQEIVLSTEIPLTATEPTIQIHYQRNKSQDYLSWGFWLWAENKDGELYEMNYQDDFGGVALYPVSQIIVDFDGSGTIGIIPRLLSGWTKDVDQDRLWDLSTYTMDDNNYYHVYLKQGDAELYMTKDLIVTPRILSAAFVSEYSVNVTTSTKITAAKLYKDGELIHEQSKLGNVKIGRLTLSKDFTPDFNATYTVEVTYTEGGTDTSEVSLSGLYSTDAFNDAYYYDGELGAIYSSSQTTFKVWSPFSTEITLKLYDKGNGGNCTATHQMTKGEKGVFEVTVQGDLEKVYYTYTVKNSKYPDGKEIVDPYAKSAGLNGLRGQVVNFANTDPEGWNNVSAAKYDRKELTVWETHVADVTSSETWTGTESYRKKFLGMAESGTTYTENGVTVTTGFDHIKELGVNAVQIVPLFDQANDEENISFNWGYNPLNYNVVEGAYSTDPTDGYVRIKEFKQLVKAYNEAGINIIMDVVYNHTNGLEGSNFDVLMPGYYYRYTTAGAASNGSGCGNETASENKMFQKFMIDSACFWAKEYKLGGFRFDLMGLHDIETMNLLTAELKKINPDIVVYGEPWTGGTSTLASNKQATQANGNDYEGYGQFNDQMRDALIKGGLCGKEELGWITNDKKVDTTDVNKILEGLKGNTAATNKIADPDKTVNYVTCHDNYTLYDRIKAAGVTDEATVEKMAVLANAVVFTSQGTTFMLAGEEMLRTKQGNSNSYNASYEVNELDYSLKVANANVFKAYQKLIAFKQDVKSMHLGKEEMTNITVSSFKGGSVISISFESEGKNYQIYHANGTLSSYTVDAEGYSLYLDTLDAAKETLEANEVALQPYQTLILVK